MFSLCGGLVSPSAVHHVFCSCCVLCVCYLLYVVPDCATTMMALLAPDGRAGLARTAGVVRKWAVLVVRLVCVVVAVCAAAVRCFMCVVLCCVRDSSPGGREARPRTSVG